jgi:hypothetical protein
MIPEHNNDEILQSGLKEKIHSVWLIIPRLQRVGGGVKEREDI